MGILKIIGEVNNVELVEQITNEQGRFIRRVIEGTVKVKSFVPISDDIPSIIEKIEENLIEAKGNLICEFNQKTKLDEIYEEYFDQATNKKVRTQLAVNLDYSRLITPKNVVEHIIYDEKRDVNIIRPIRNDLYISKDEFGCRVVEKIKDAT